MSFYFILTFFLTLLNNEIIILTDGGVITVDETEVEITILKLNRNNMDEKGNNDIF